jgi:hypothetical protein
VVAIAITLILGGLLWFTRSYLRDERKPKKLSEKQVDWSVDRIATAILETGRWRKSPAELKQTIIEAVRLAKIREAPPSLSHEVVEVHCLMIELVDDYDRIVREAYAAVTEYDRSPLVLVKRDEGTLAVEDLRQRERLVSHKHRADERYVELVEAVTTLGFHPHEYEL